MIRYEDSEGITNETRAELEARAESFEEQLSRDALALERVYLAESEEMFFDQLEDAHEADRYALVESLAVGGIEGDEGTFLRELEQLDPIDAVKTINRHTKELAEAYARSWALAEKRRELLGFESQISSRALRALRDHSNEEPKALVDDERRPGILRRVVASVASRFRG